MKNAPSLLAGLAAALALATFVMLGAPADAAGTTHSTPDLAGSCSSSFTSGAAGITPASGGGTSNFLRADGTWSAPPSGGAPGGSGSEIQYRAGASTLGAVTGSSVSGGQLTLGDTLFLQGNTGTAPLSIRSNNVGADCSTATFGTVGNQFVGIYSCTSGGFGTKAGLMILGTGQLTVSSGLSQYGVGETAAGNLSGQLACNSTDLGYVVEYSNTTAHTVNLCECAQTNTGVFAWSALSAAGNCT